MEYVHISNYSITVCPCCNELIYTKGIEGNEVIEKSLKLFETHLQIYPDCQKYQNKLPTVSEMCGILKEK